MAQVPRDRADRWMRLTCSVLMLGGLVSLWQGIYWLALPCGLIAITIALVGFHRFGFSR